MPPDYEIQIWDGKTWIRAHTSAQLGQAIQLAKRAARRLQIVRIVKTEVVWVSQENI